MGHVLTPSQLQYETARVLFALRAEVGFSRFGLVIQALFAHVLLRMGAEVIDVRNPGHPDIIARLDGELHNIEVEAASRKTTARRLQLGDLDVLQDVGSGGSGYFCVLDCGPPAEWLYVNVATLGARANENLRMSLLRAYADERFSADSTAQFSDLIVKEAQYLPQLSYSRLRQEALEGRGR